MYFWKCTDDPVETKLLLSSDLCSTLHLLSPATSPRHCSRALKTHLFKQASLLWELFKSISHWTELAAFQKGRCDEMTYCAKLVVVYFCHILMHLSGLTCWCMLTCVFTCAYLCDLMRSYLCSPVCVPVWRVTDSVWSAGTSVWLCSCVFIDQCLRDCSHWWRSRCLHCLWTTAGIMSVFASSLLMCC